MTTELQYENGFNNMIYFSFFVGNFVIFFVVISFKRTVHITTLTAGWTLFTLRYFPFNAVCVFSPCPCLVVQGSMLMVVWGLKVRACFYYQNNIKYIIVLLELNFEAKSFHCMFWLFCHCHCFSLNNDVYVTYIRKLGELLQFIAPPVGGACAVR